jgi:hypothetical protein
MTTKTLESLTKKRSDLVQESERLRREGEARRLTGSSMADIKDRIEAIESEMRGLNPDFKQLRREHGAAEAERMVTTSSYKALLATALVGIEGWAALKLTTDTHRGQGTLLPPLPPFAEEQVRQSVLWLQFLTRLGLDAATIPPSLRKLVGGEA